MTYEKINWDGTIMLTPAKLRHMETQYDAAAASINQNMRQGVFILTPQTRKYMATTGRAGRHGDK